jgi:ketosteroid isomerase-like protein
MYAGTSRNGASRTRTGDRPLSAPQSEVVGVVGARRERRIAADYRRLRSIRALVPIRLWRDTGRAMSRENVEVVRRAWDAFSRGDVPEAFEVFATDVEFDVSRDIWGPVVGGGYYRGVEGIANWLRDLYEAWEKFEMGAAEVIDAGNDEVITVLFARGRGRASGIALEHRPAGVSTLRDGKVVRVVWFPTREEALEAVGLQE